MRAPDADYRPGVRALKARDSGVSQMPGVGYAATPAGRQPQAWVFRSWRLSRGPCYMLPHRLLTNC